VRPNRAGAFLILNCAFSFRNTPNVVEKLHATYLYTSSGLSPRAPATNADHKCSYGSGLTKPTNQWFAARRAEKRRSNVSAGRIHPFAAHVLTACPIYGESVASRHPVHRQLRGDYILPDQKYQLRSTQRTRASRLISFVLKHCWSTNGAEAQASPIQFLSYPPVNQVLCLKPAETLLESYGATLTPDFWLLQN
jgi:hypothetical protein